jgi:hypothetical protein
VKNEDITVVVQGPVQSLPERPQDEGITRRCLSSVREHLPGSRIILSTWPDQDLDGLVYDELVINDDPGPNIIGYARDGAPRKENTNRQIVCTVGGLKRVGTRYAMKLRADNYLTGSGFKDLQTRYPARAGDWRLLKERVVVTNTLARKFYRGRRVAFFLSDFFAFGLTEDVLDIWDLPLLDDYPFDPALTGALQHRGAPARTVDVDQELAERFINKHVDPPLILANVFDTSGSKVRDSDLFFANNFVVAEPGQIGLGLPLKFTQGRQAKFSSQATCLTAPEWERLYRRHCDPDFGPVPALVYRFRVWLARLLFVPAKRLENALRSARDAREYRRAARQRNA